MPDLGYSLAELDSRSLLKHLRDLLILPVGALEAHGPQNPLGADMLQAEKTAMALARRVHGIVAPGIPYGVCPGGAHFPGTLSLNMGTLTSLVEDVVGEYARMGFRRILILSGHGAMQHMAALREGGQRAIARHPGLRVAALCDYEFVYELRGKEAPATDGHGGLLETSRVMALAPDLVGPERPVVEYKANRFALASPSSEEWPESVMGDTTEASAELGRRVQIHVLERLEKTVREVLPE